VTRNLRGRLNRLERRPQTDGTGHLSPLFWAAICGIVSVEALDPDTRRLVESLYEPPAGPDPIAQRLAEIEALAAARTDLPIGLKELGNGEHSYE
jgi:hypothetical protein